jgi:hypothetical protein
MKIRNLVVMLCAALSLAACGGNVSEIKATPAECPLDPAGSAFTFIINNTGTRMLRLAYGCGSALPITLNTSHGNLGIGEESAEACGVPCESVYQGNPNFGCSDCGPGYGASLGPGQSAMIQWDRRVFQKHSAPPACSGLETSNECALGLLLKESMVSGMLGICTDGAMGTSGDGYCSSDFIESLPIHVDLSKDSLSIDVQ